LWGLLLASGISLCGSNTLVFQPDFFNVDLGSVLGGGEHLADQIGPSVKDQAVIPAVDVNGEAVLPVQLNLTHAFLLLKHGF